MATVFSAQFVVACPTPVRAADDWLKPRDREGGNKENQNWIIALKRDILAGVSIRGIRVLASCGAMSMRNLEPLDPPRLFV